ncbi:hypothetical protein EJ04DRAFT_220174 [Polyplosphaeria fusca]|uniref:Anaphase-promoting complex subunit 5 n=1 Tax=Polyplosphaeria fusca TaxID=682080 RepID=A0A9P4R146_9PLEO|nr:hypothetical protein EJ04DRAFT_220174 [Polyplosphaeria fusca]
MGTFRYLTAHKISILVLVNLYCNSAIPPGSIIPVLSFIISHIIQSPSCHARAADTKHDHDNFTSIQALEDVLQAHSSTMPGRTLLDVFLKHLWEINSFDALNNLFTNANDLFMTPRDDDDDEDKVSVDRTYLLKTSPLGAFVRRARLEFMRLQFDDALKLWDTFIEYRAPTAQWTKRLAGLASSGADVNAADMAVQPGDTLFEVAYPDFPRERNMQVTLFSVDDVERLMDFQLEQMQRLGSRVPSDMREKLRFMISPHGTALKQSHLVKFFDAWRAGDYTTAFDNLHRYYDYAMQTREKHHYQYALLHMAILHADFGCFGEAIAAINETISTARENQDLTCLNFSLSWLNHMSKAYPKQMKGAGYMGMLGSERDGLTFLKTKAKESKMHNLLSATLLNEATLCLAAGDSIPRAFEYMYQASHLNIRENVGNHGGQLLLQSTIYSRLGLTELSSAYCDLLLHCYGQICPIEERIRATCRTAFGAAENGRYDQGLQLIESTDFLEQHSLKSRQFLFLSVGIIKLKRATHLNDWVACETLLRTLEPDCTADTELCFMLSKTRILYMIARGDFEESFCVLDSLSLVLKEDGADISQRIAVLTLKAYLYLEAGQRERGFSVALRAASLAFKARLMPNLWSAVGQLGAILNSLGEFDAALRLLHAILPQSLEHVDQAQGAILYSHVGDSYIGLAGQTNNPDTGGTRLRATRINQAEMHIDRAREYFKRVEDVEGECEQLMKKAVLAKLRGDERLAEEWAQNHNRVWEEGRTRIAMGAQ